MTKFDSEKAYEEIQKLNSSKVSDRIKAIERLPEISEMLGTDRTILELMPFIVNSSVQTEKTLCEAISKFRQFPLSNLTEEHLNAIFEVINPLTEIDIPSIRRELVSFINGVCDSVDKKVLSTLIPGKIDEFLKNDWPSINLIGVELAAEVFGIMPEECREQILAMFFEFASKDIPILQREIVPSCIKFIDFTNNPKIIQIVSNMTKSDSPTIAYEIPNFIAQYATCDDCDMNNIILLINGLLESPNWRVRCKLFMSLNDINNTKELPKEFLIEIFHKALKDEEDEIRIAAAQQIPILQNFFEDCKDIINSLVKDKSPHVRSALMESLSECNPDLASKCLQHMLEDDVREVRASALEAINIINLPLEDIENLLYDFLKSNREWREREEVANLFISKKLEDLDIIEKLIFDEAAVVRKTIIVNLPELDINEEDLKDIAAKAAKHDDYQIRQTAVLLILTNELYQDEECLSLLRNLSKDPIVNVRLTVALYTPRELGIVKALLNDKDIDVRESAADECREITSQVF